MGLKLSILSKFFNPNFKHDWKDVITNQLQYPKYPIVSIENGNKEFLPPYARDLISNYHIWKNRVCRKFEETPNLCVWKNKLIPPIGHKIYNEVLNAYGSGNHVHK